MRIIKAIILSMCLTLAFCAVWAPDGSQFASVDETGFVRITDVRTGESLPLLEAPPWKLALSLDWSPDGRLLVVRGSSTPGQCLWMVAVAERRARLFPTQRDFWSPRWTEGGASLFVIDP